MWIILTCISRGQGTRISKTILINKNKVGRTTLISYNKDFYSYNDQKWVRDRYIDQ